MENYETLFLLASIFRCYCRKKTERKVFIFTQDLRRLIYSLYGSEKTIFIVFWLSRVYDFLGIGYLY